MRDERLRNRVGGDRHKTRAAGDRHAPRPFVGVDGEGTTNPRDEPVLVGKGTVPTVHQYRLLRAGDQYIESPTELTWWECLEFLCDLPHEGNRSPLYVSFFFDYDATMIMRHMPAEARENILKRPLNVDAKKQMRWLGNVGTYVEAPDGSGYRVSYMPRKEFKVRRARSPHDTKGGSWTVVSDVGTFFQKAFVKVLQDWDVVNDTTLALIQKGKAERSVVSHIDDEVRHYNHLEVLALTEVMNAFRKGCQAIGYVPKKWQGPGCLASAAHGRHGTSKYEDLSIHPKLEAIAIMALHFGRFEPIMIGDIPGPVLEYDICSAYPWAMTQLPCLEHGSWEQTSVEPAGDKLYVAMVRFWHDAGTRVGGLAVRRADGSIHYPLQGAGAYWSPELRACGEVGTRWEASDYWVYEKHCTCKPFDWIYAIYAERIRVGKTKIGMMFKLLMNSLYGKMAQTVGAAPYSNPIWAGLITSYTRSMLLKATAKHGENIVMYATDAVYSLVPLDVELGQALGQWELKTHEDGMFIVQAGVYFASGNLVPKTRGVPQSRIIEHEQDLRRLWSDGLLSDSGGPGNISIPLTIFCGLRLAHLWGRPEIAGEWISTTRELGFNWASKRLGAVKHGTYVHTGMIPGSPTNISHPYDAAIRTDILSRRVEDEWTRYLDQPDWGDQWGID